MYIGVVVLMRLGAFVGFVRRRAFMCGKTSRGTRTRRGQGWRPKKRGLDECRSVEATGGGLQGKSKGRVRRQGGGDDKREN